jgi:drug/metabolite transporter (DMT)-like permease
MNGAQADEPATPLPARRLGAPPVGPTRLPLAGLAHLGVLYVVWGSTYLGIRVAVGPGGGFPPFMLGAFRVGVAGLILLAVARLLGRSLAVGRQDLRRLALTGLLLWLGGNGLVTVAETRAESGYAALLVAATPLWVALMEAVLDRKRPSLRLVVALLIGLAGIAVLSAPSLMEGGAADPLSFLLLIAAGMLWGAGLLWQQRRPVALQPLATAAYQQVFGALGFVVLALVFGEPLPTPSTEAWLAWGYLTLFGSVLAFTSFVVVLRLLPASLVTTYAYVNPVIAVLLGALLLGERVTVWTVVGAVLVLIAVAGIFRERSESAR